MRTSRNCIHSIIVLECDNEFERNQGFKDYIISTEYENYLFTGTESPRVTDAADSIKLRWSLEIRVWRSTSKKWSHAPHGYVMGVHGDTDQTGKTYIAQPLKTITDEEMRGLVVERRI